MLTLRDAPAYAVQDGVRNPVIYRGTVHAFKSIARREVSRGRSLFSRRRLATAPTSVTFLGLQADESQRSVAPARGCRDFTQACRRGCWAPRSPGRSISPFTITESSATKRGRSGEGRHATRS